MQTTSTETLYALFLQQGAFTTDTRQVTPGAIFFALRGDTFNGNRFAAQALAAGCAYCVVDEADVAATDERMLYVPDALRALQDMAALHRRRLGLPLLQITGTNGKTTTKELTSAVLARRYRVLATAGNFNNDIGVPKTLLRLTAEHEVGVIETGASHPGDIRSLCRMVTADYGLITNVGKAHLEGFGSFEGVVRTKSELYDDLRTRPGTLVFLHADDPILCRQAAGLRAWRYGQPGRGYDVEGEALDDGPYLSLRWRRQGGPWHTVSTHLIGTYNLSNVLAAAAVGAYFKVPDEQITQALTDYVPTNQRSELRQTGRNRLIIDAYNANPTSMAAAIDNFCHLQATRKMAILGDMRELGTASAEEHQRVVNQILTAGCERIWLVGEHFQATRHESAAIRCFAHTDEVKAALAQEPLSGYTILIKGSHGTRLYELPDQL